MQDYYKGLCVSLILFAVLWLQHKSEPGLVLARAQGGVESSVERVEQLLPLARDACTEHITPYECGYYSDKIREELKSGSSRLISVNSTLSGYASLDSDELLAWRLNQNIRLLSFQAEFRDIQAHRRKDSQTFLKPPLQTFNGLFYFPTVP